MEPDHTFPEFLEPEHFYLVYKTTPLVPVLSDMNPSTRLLILFLKYLF